MKDFKYGHLEKMDSPDNADVQEVPAKDQPDCKDTPVTHGNADFSHSAADAIETKEYRHWDSEAERKQNMDAIIGYDFKKRSVDKASLVTQRDILTRYRDSFDKDAYERMSSELGSNKTEIYNSPYFSSHFAQDHGNYIVTGVRTIRDGKICLRDNDNVDVLVHTATHETMHDLSFQKSRDVSGIAHQLPGQDIPFSRADSESGIHRIEKVAYPAADGTDLGREVHFNRYLNEGFTELYTIEEMQRRGEFPDFSSYTEEVNWACAIRDKVGEEAVVNAYFGGDISSLKSKVDSMSDIPNAWRILNQNIDTYHSSLDPLEKKRCKETVDSIIMSLREPKEHVRRRVR